MNDQGMTGGNGVGIMRIEMYKIVYDTHKFSAEMDTSAEVGEHQIILWYSEKISLETLPLKQLKLQLLLKALKEPYKSQLVPVLEQQKKMHREHIEQDIRELQRPFQNRKLPGATKQQIKQLRTQLQHTLTSVDAAFLQQNILPLERYCFDLASIEKECEVYGESYYLRDFFFEEVNYGTIRTFCYEFATNPAYRQDIREKKAPWIQRNALFTQNLFSIVGEKALLANDGSYIRQAREFFRWLDLHYKEVLAHPEYQRLSETDSSGVINHTDKETAMRPIIELMQSIPALVCRDYCQGITGKVEIYPYALLPNTSHEEYAYITFNTLSYFIHDTIIASLHAYPNITTDRIPCDFTSSLLLRSTGDNLRFRAELLQLAQQLYSITQQTQEDVQAANDSIQYWNNTCYPKYQAQPNDPGGILPGRLNWLCQPAAIEKTLHHLSHINHWAKATDLLYYDDRQGLYSIKAAIIAQASSSGTIIPISYVDGSPAFRHNFSTEVAASTATELLFEELNTFPHMESDEDNTIAHQLYQHITGQSFQPKENCTHLIAEQIEHTIHDSLLRLINQALQSRQPIPYQDLMELFIYPTDLIEIPWSRYVGNWDTLNPSEQRKLDPEGLSLIGFHYSSNNADYHFHLPYRSAEQFLSAELLHQLRTQTSQERHEYASSYGRPITSAESESYPIEEILQALGVNIGNVCPRKLERKTERSSYIYPGYHDDWGEDDDDDAAI